MISETTKARREKLAEKLANGEAVVIFANHKRNLDKFSQDKNFLYFTGLDEPKLIYLTGRINDTVQEFLFVERTDPARVVWEGKKLQPDEASGISGIKQVKYLDEFYTVLQAMASALRKIHANLGHASLNMPPTHPMFMLEPLRAREPRIEIRRIDDLVTPLRKIKDAWEIKQLQRAIDITGEGIKDIWKNARQGMMEYELEALLFYRMQISGLKHWGFSPIIASGINAATLHYERNECRIKAGEMVLMDVGAGCNGYSADITRCFPIGKSFSARQKQIYSLVLDVQKKIIALIKPGVKLSALQQETRNLLAKGMIKLKLIKGPEEIGKYYMHGVSHFLGLDTHDLGGREAVLEEGNIITVEPGIYMPEEKIGVRIEDDILVTKRGHKNLSAKIPKEIADIEKIRRQALK